MLFCVFAKMTLRDEFGLQMRQKLQGLMSVPTPAAQAEAAHLFTRETSSIQTSPLTLLSNFHVGWRTTAI
jgi:hypothetical protein